MDHATNKKMIEMAKRANDEKYENNSRDQLKRAVTTKFKTTMIGALSQFEEFFGYLWGHDEDRQLTHSEQEFKKVWDLVRTQVLNNGNAQLRATMQEIDQYTVKWNKFKTDFIVKPKDY